MKTTLLLIATLLLAVPAFSLDFDQNVTPDLIFGSGNDNGFFTVDSQSTPGLDTMELGLRGKLRFDATGQPQNYFGSDGAGSYFFQAGVAAGQSFPTATWSFEWHVNTDADGTDHFKLDDFFYELGLDIDPSGATNYLTFDPITPTVSVPFYDHSMGNNTTANGAGVEATTEAEYATYLSQYNVAQQSWRYSWMIPSGSFDPTTSGVYDIYLKAIDKPSGTVVAETHIQIIADDGVANEYTSWGNVKSLFR